MSTIDLKHPILQDSDRETIVSELQKCLTTLIDGSLQLKQAHWNVVGERFLSFHEQLDVIIETTRAASDEVAERIATLGEPADGRAATVADHSQLDVYPEGRHRVAETVSITAQRLTQISKTLRESIATAGDVDPITEDLLISVCSKVEKHLWMVQSQEL